MRFSDEAHEHNLSNGPVNLAETRRFELLKGLTPYLVSSEAHSTGLCDVSELQGEVYLQLLITPKARKSPPLEQFGQVEK